MGIGGTHWENMEKCLLVHNGKLFKVSDGAGDIFWVSAKEEEQVKLLLFKRGGHRNLEIYTIEQQPISWCEMIVGEVRDYETLLEYSKAHEELVSRK